MKILNLKILSPDKKIIRDIDFQETGISIILADIKKKDDAKETINICSKSNRFFF